MHFLAANINRELAKTAFNHEAVTGPAKTKASKRVLMLTRRFTMCVTVSNSLLFFGHQFPPKKLEELNQANSGLFQVPDSTILDSEPSGKP